MDTHDLYSDSIMMSTKYKNISDHGWSQFYEKVEDTLPIIMPLPREQAVKINMVCDASHTTDLIRRSSTIDIVFHYIVHQSSGISSATPNHLPNFSPSIGIFPVFNTRVKSEIHEM